MYIIFIISNNTDTDPSDDAYGQTIEREFKCDAPADDDDDDDEANVIEFISYYYYYYQDIVTATTIDHM